MQIIQQIETAFNARTEISHNTVDEKTKEAINQAIELLDTGEKRIAEPTASGWQVNDWLKKAVLLFFRIQDNHPLQGGFTQFYDKVPLKFTHTKPDEFQTMGVRIVPPATVRKGSYLAPNTVLMPCYINIGAYVDSGTMVDTWATVGSCAQIGKNVHISGGAGIGGVLEPLQANPVIIEDDCFIGARAEIAEGVIVGKGSVISMGVYLGQSTKIYDRETGEITFGKIPPGSVVVPGSIPGKDGKHSVYCAIIIKKVDERTKSKVGLNALLRDVEHA